VTASTAVPPPLPLLLVDGECAVCRVIARWVAATARTRGEPTLREQSIGDDPRALRALNGKLDIWDAYKTVHLLMPDGSIRTGGEAVAEVLRRIPGCRWFAWSFAVGSPGFRPFQAMLDALYGMLSNARPLFGCAGCNTPGALVRSVATAVDFANGGTHPHADRERHFTAATKRLPPP